MGWTERNHGRRYYYSRTRVDGKWYTVYRGPGEMGELAAEADDALRNLRRLELESDRGMRRLVGMATAEIDRLSAAAQAVVNANLLLAGYYRHDRGPWRKRRRR